MKVNLNKKPCMANFVAKPPLPSAIKTGVAKPPPIPGKIKPAAVKTTVAKPTAAKNAVVKVAVAETAVRKFDQGELENFFLQYWNHSNGIPDYWYRESLPKTSIGLRKAHNVMQLKKNGHKY